MDYEFIENQKQAGDISSKVTICDLRDYNLIKLSLVTS